MNTKLTNGQPKNLAQLKRALIVGTFFVISRPGAGSELRRVIKAGATEIVSIVPFDAGHRINQNGGSYLSFGKAAFWDFSGGAAALYHSDTGKSDTTLIFCIVILPHNEAREQKYQEWAAATEAAKQQAQQEKAARMAADAERKNAQEYAEKVELVLKVLTDGGTVRVDTNVTTWAADGGIKERNVILYIADMYGVSVPLKTQGWIKTNLSRIEYQVDTKALTVFYSGKESKTVHLYLFKIIRAVKNEAEFFGKKTA